MRDDKIISLRLNSIEQEQLDYCVKHCAGYYSNCKSSYIKHLIYQDYIRMLNINRTNKRL